MAYKAMNLELVMRALYLSEINCRIESFWDAGWKASIGDRHNGFRASEDVFYSFEEMGTWLLETACELYPESDLNQNRDRLAAWVAEEEIPCLPF